MNKEKLLELLNNEKNPELLLFIMNNNDLSDIKLEAIGYDTYQFLCYEGLTRIQNLKNDSWYRSTILDIKIMYNILRTNYKFI